MNIKTIIKLTPHILSSIFFSTSALAFSSPPESTDSYSPAEWSSSQSAKNDARDAIEHDDLRLLRFAGRGQNIPGVDNTQTQQYSDRCGIRLFDEFGDIIREREQLEMMKKAREYALEYNEVILTRCKPAD
ncbi:MAG: hypothetical protein KAT61_01975 [Gammaproteobacteria bacterium]|nr:hypothetical protein [Gammaproteobacteria bacterium]